MQNHYYSVPPSAVGVILCVLVLLPCPSFVSTAEGFSSDRISLGVDQVQSDLNNSYNYDDDYVILGHHKVTNVKKPVTLLPNITELWILDPDNKDKHPKKRMDNHMGQYLLVGFLVVMFLAIIFFCAARLKDGACKQIEPPIVTSVPNPAGISVIYTRPNPLRRQVESNHCCRNYTHHNNNESRTPSDTISLMSYQTLDRVSRDSDSPPPYPGIIGQPYLV